MNKVIYEITYNKLDEIYSFVRNSLYEFEYLNVGKEDVKILMPNYIKYLLQSNYRRPIYYLPLEQEYNEAKFFDVEVYPHFKNEIVVYCKEFHLNEKLNQPKIFEL